MTSNKCRELKKKNITLQLCKKLKILQKQYQQKYKTKTKQQILVSNLQKTLQNETLQNETLLETGSQTSSQTENVTTQTKHKQRNIKQTKQKTDEQKLKEYIYRLKGFGPLSLSPEAKSFLKKKVKLNTELLSQQQMIDLFEGDSSNIYINQLRANKKKQEARKKKKQQQKTLEQEQAKKRLIETQKQKLKLEREKKAQLVKGKQLSKQLENIGKLGVVSNRLQQERKKEQARLQAQAKKLQAKQKKEKEQAKKLQAQAQAKQAKAKQLQAKMKEQAQANELKERKKKIYQIFEKQSGGVTGEQISLLDDYFKSLTETQKKNKDVIIRFYDTYDYLEKPIYLQKIVKQLETQKRNKEQQQKKLEKEQANKRLIEAQRIKTKQQQAELKKIQEKKEQMKVKKRNYIGILEETNNINELIELLNNKEYSIIQKEIDKKLDEMLKSPKNEMIRLIKLDDLPEKYVENKYPNVQKLKIFHNELKLIKDGNYKPSQNDEILTKYYNDIEKMKKQKKSYTKTKNVKKKKEKKKDTPRREQVKYEGIDMTQNAKSQKQKMIGILSHINKIKSKQLQKSTNIGLNTMKININQNLNILKTGIFNNTEFDANKEDYKTFYTNKLKEIQTQIQKRQQRKKQQQLQIQKRQRQKKQQQKRIQNLKTKQITKMTEEQKTQMKEFLEKDRTLVEGFGSKLLELYEDVNKKPPFVEQIQEQLNDIEKKRNQGNKLSQNQKQFLNKYKKNNQKKNTDLAYIYKVETPKVKTTTSDHTSSSQTQYTEEQLKLMGTLQGYKHR